MKNLSNPALWEGFDIESSGTLPEHGLQPWSNQSFLTSYATSQWRSSSLTRVSADAQVPDFPELESTLQRWAKDKVPVVGWNMAFDVSWLIKMGYRDLVMQIDWLDGMLFWRHLYRTPLPRSYGLKNAVNTFLPEHSGYDDDVDFHDMSIAATMKRLVYNKKDAVFTLKLAYDFYRKLATSPRMLRACILEQKAIPLVADSYITGLHVDKDHVVNLHAELTDEITKLIEVLAGYTVSPSTLASPAQLRHLLYTEWNLPTQHLTDKGAFSTDKAALTKLAAIDTRVEKIMEYREANNLRTKFVTKIIESCHYNGEAVTHPTANIGSTYTGRMTFSSSILKGKAKRQTGFALHQMKRAARFRRSIKAPDGWVMVEWDAAGQEYRWMAIESGDPTMLELCQDGQDPHSYMGAEMSDYTYPGLMSAVAHKEHGAGDIRMAGKVGNLSCQYRIGVNTLLSTARVQYGLPWDRDMAEKVHRTYHSTYPGVKRFWKQKIRDTKANGYAETIAGRRVIVEGNWGGDNSWALESTAVNFPVQGVGADQKYLAMAALKPLLTKYGGKFYFELHDGIYAIFKESVAEKAAYAGQRLLNTLPYKKAWGFTPPIPLPWDIKIGSNWGDSKELT